MNLRSVCGANLVIFPRKFGGGVHCEPEEFILSHVSTLHRLESLVNFKSPANFCQKVVEKDAALLAKKVQGYLDYKKTPPTQDRHRAVDIALV